MVSLFLMLIGVGISCRILYYIASYLYGLIFLLSFTCNYVVSVRKGFLFLLVFGVGCVIIL